MQKGCLALHQIMPLEPMAYPCKGHIRYPTCGLERCPDSTEDVCLLKN
jgi:hypothetical protein